MKVAYFPGCTLRTKAKELDFFARRCAELLGIELCEIKDWQCCGGVYVTSNDEIATKLSSVRALIAARDMDMPLVTVCSACHNVIKQTNNAMANDPVFSARANAYMAQDKNPPAPYHGETKVYHYLELLRDVVGFDKLRAAVKNPLSERSVGAYYGCLLLRPGKVMAFDDVENPKIIENFIRAIGAEPVNYQMRNECCGGYVALESPDLAKKKSSAVTSNAAACGAAELVTACPLCKYNLTENGTGEVRTLYFTELLAEALGIREEYNAEQK